VLLRPPVAREVSSGAKFSSSAVDKTDEGVPGASCLTLFGANEGSGGRTELSVSVLDDFVGVGGMGLPLSSGTSTLGEAATCGYVETYSRKV
jgi:hypothetical protein